MDVYEPRSKRTRKARERHVARQTRRSAVQDNVSRLRHAAETRLPGGAGLWQRAQLVARDALWYARNTRYLRLGALALVGVLALLFIGSNVVQGRIFPNVWALGINIGGLTVPEAAAALQETWNNRLTIQLVDGDRAWPVSPAEIGFRLDATGVAEAARGVGLSGIPMGYEVLPVVSVDFDTAQNRLLDLTAQTDIAPYNAGYAWENGEVVGKPGRDGRMLDVPQMVDRLKQDPVTIVRVGRADLLMSRLPPLAADPAPYLEDARAVITRPPDITGYDPFRDETVVWSTNQEVFASWLQVTSDGLDLRMEMLGPFVEATTRSLNPSGDARYLDPAETRDTLRQAIRNKSDNVLLRIRYRPTTYQVVSGDTGYRIARKTGLPFYWIEQANEGRDLNRLSVGDIISLPSRDLTLPDKPVPNKRIVVNLDTQTMVAFENGQMVFQWLISSGLPAYPTYPGVYQILSHDEVARGGSYTLCGSAGCGQWEMYWFMGIYEVVPGLMNGFHGAVLLPNGAYLGGGNVGAPYTFGCVMAQNDNAKLLYDWAETGTLVEIISSDFPPQSPLGEMARSQFSGQS